jgi:hypothetical protein
MLRNELNNESLYYFMASKIAHNDKKTGMLFKCYKANKDSVDLFNSMQVYYNKSFNPTTPADPNLEMLKDL